MNIPIEPISDGKVIVDVFVYNDMVLQNLNSQRRIQDLEDELERTRNGVKHYEGENQRLHTLLFNLTNSK